MEKFDLNEKTETTASDSAKVFTTCQGKIQSNGFCDTCGQQGAQGTAMFCGRLNDVTPIAEKPQQFKTVDIGEIFSVEGKCYLFRNPRTASEKPTTDHGHILHEIIFVKRLIRKYENRDRF